MSLNPIVTEYIFATGINCPFRIKQCVLNKVNVGRKKVRKRNIKRKDKT